MSIIFRDDVSVYLIHPFDIHWNIIKPKMAELEKWPNRKEIEIIKEISNLSSLAGRISWKHWLFVTHLSLPYLYCNAVPLPVMSQQSYHYQGLTSKNSASNRQRPSRPSPTQSLTQNVWSQANIVASLITVCPGARQSVLS